MSHTYYVRTEVQVAPGPVDAAVVERLLDEFAKFWNVAITGVLVRNGATIVWSEGRDRLAGLRTLEDLRIRLAFRLTEILEYHVNVVLHVEDQEGPETGRKFTLQRGPTLDIDPARVEEILSSVGDKPDPVRDLTRSMALELQRLYLEIRKANRAG